MNRSAPSHRDLPAGPAAPFDVRLDDVLRYASAIGALLVTLLPAARGSHEVIGWLPLWLLVMPLAAWWALRRFSGAGVHAEGASDGRTAVTLRRRRYGPQARRRARPGLRAAFPRAA